MEKAKRLKHEADSYGEQERDQKAMKYMQAVLCLILCGNDSEVRSEKQEAFNMYTNTLDLVK